MRSQTFKMLARWSLMAAACAGPGLANSVITTPRARDPSVSMLELETLFGLDPADGYSIAAGSHLWTNDSNAALYGNMLLLITTLGGNQGMMSQLFQPGATFSSKPNPYAQVSSAQIVLQGSSAQGAVPEPGTMGLLGGTLLFLCCYGFYRTDRTNRLVRQHLLNGPIQPTHQL